MDFQYRPHVYVYQLYEDGGEDDDEGEDGVVSYKEWQLPAADFEGSWDALYYESSIKRHLLQYASSALLFSDRAVNSQLISWNRVVLLHGPPGTGKTSLCKALAHKLSIRFSDRYTSSQLVEVNAHSLFSKWFSESGKLVSKLFASITELLEEPQALVFVLIDEVESLTAARKAAASGGEPSDAIRAVNALLTQLDALRRFPNVMVLTTSNITEAIDVAFVDRADIKAYLGPPSAAARYEILRSGVLELARAGIIAGLGPQHLLPYKELLLLPSSKRQQSDQTVAALKSHSNGAGTGEQRALLTAEALSRALAEVVAQDSRYYYYRVAYKLNSTNLDSFDPDPNDPTLLQIVDTGDVFDAITLLKVGRYDNFGISIKHRAADSNQVTYLFQHGLELGPHGNDALFQSSTSDLKDFIGQNVDSDVAITGGAGQFKGATGDVTHTGFDNIRMNHTYIAEVYVPKLKSF
eukprot:gene10268-10427_t